MCDCEAGNANSNNNIKLTLLFADGVDKGHDAHSLLLGLGARAALGIEPRTV
eukprot:GDKH01014548.1.p1 GENE.GDKH01014548.1~~GDKH01014548.1.p1  ORF type:complete len:52 (-),score=5.57 GDKH01014548.1:4-159(-)